MAKRASKGQMVAPLEGADLLKSQLRCWLSIARDCCMVESDLADLLRPLDLSVAQHEVLAKLTTRDGITQQELAGRLLVTKGNVTGLLTRLEERGLVQRRTDPDDARKNLVFLTRKGRALEDRALQRLYELIGDTFGVLTAEEVAQLHDMMDRIGTRLRQRRDRAG